MGVQGGGAGSMADAVRSGKIAITAPCSSRGLDKNANKHRLFKSIITGKLPTEEWTDETESNRETALGRFLQYNKRDKGKIDAGVYAQDLYELLPPYHSELMKKLEKNVKQLKKKADLQMCRSPSRMVSTVEIIKIMWVAAWQHVENKEVDRKTAISYINHRMKELH